MKDVYLLAYPAGHSVSPTMHNAAFQHLGLDFHYQAYEVSPDDLSKAIDKLREAQVAGSNVTVPHKQAVMPYMDSLSDVAQQIGAVNTIINQNGKLHGHNTDASGYLRALEDVNFNPEGKSVVMLGAGGAARAVLYALLNAKAKHVYIHNRTTDKALSLAEDFKSMGNTEAKVEAVTIDNLEEAIKSCHLLVNTTSVGMVKNGIDPKVSPVPDGYLPTQGLVSDIVYIPAQPQLLVSAKQAGLATQNGLAMLVYQGAYSFKEWTGIDAPTEIMFQALKHRLAENS